MDISVAYEILSVEAKGDRGEHWWVYQLQGSNGSVIVGQMQGITESSVRTILKKQIAKANRRRELSQQWPNWNWSKPEQIRIPELGLKT